MNTTVRALIAEDEAILAQTLAQSLQRLWPELEIVGTAPNGYAAVEQALALRPDILFLDIKMPGKTGMEAAHELTDEWPAHLPFPQIVFVTAYDEYAVDAFEHAAVDYVLKPVSDQRLARTVERLQARLAKPQSAGSELERVLDQLRALVPAQAANAERLSIIRAAVGNQIRMIPIEDVVYFEATDKYVNVVTAEAESLIRTSLRDLIAQLDPAQFWQVHRSLVVNNRAIELAHRDESGKITLKLRGRKENLPVSRVFAHLFRQM